MLKRIEQARYDLAVAEVEMAFDSERSSFLSASTESAWHEHLSKEVVGILVAIGVKSADAESAVFDMLADSGDPDAALEGLAVMLRAASRTGDLPSLAAEFGVNLSGGHHG